jgi:hypothetical protein
MMRFFAVSATALGAVLLAGACSSRFESAAAGAATSLDAGDTGGAQGATGGASTGTGGSRASGGRVGTAGGGTGNVVVSGSGGNVMGGTGGVVGGGTDGAVIGNGGAVSSDASIADAGVPPVSCNTPADCPAPTTVCQTAACVGHQCGFVGVPSAIPTTNRSGDCKKLVCNQNGAEVAIDDLTDSDDGNVCTTDSCQGGAAVHAVRVGASCPGGVCDANGVCVAGGCTLDSDCPQGATECSKQTCAAGICKRVPPGTLCNGFLDQCDDLGNCVDCWNSGGCDECCVCSNKVCIPA